MIVVIVGIVILSKDNSKDKKDETETTKTEQTTEVKKATEQPTATEKENTRTTQPYTTPIRSSDYIQYVKTRSNVRCIDNL